ncbi:TetR/AcrR family transcriptional regulator [Rubellicoccus peritrichatus]|uniref:TetR/AcrR family transcriptional regulator n=1 Tax=Rubellicoccus peritrichatus TaxID=3080537 RepID=A0AAQ3QWG0_9BACT|nr:TetR/AcrR family transcriptional regulator [Puniceicoccus sp. CR14]WOO41835.1 TetR/AcrR family transcriptional regulator [Puniceicoccus sp. CR14]
MNATETRQRMLQEAEKLYSEHGFDGMSLRTLTSDAGVNLASVNYHFGSKKELVMAMFQERIMPMNEERLERLNKAREAGNGVASLEGIFDALLIPVAERAQVNGVLDMHFLKMVGRAISESDDFWHELFIRNFQELSKTFVEALAEALPDLPREDVEWRFHFAVSSMLGTLVKHGQFARRMQGLGRSTDIESMFRRLRDFLCAGFRGQVEAMR